MTIQRKVITQPPRRTFSKIFNFDMGRHEHFGGSWRDPVPALSEGGRPETLVAPGRMSAAATGTKGEYQEERHE
ncbi:MAG TPA: hypothetical protein VKV95_20375 [Terriglobia bacterium]|nr:hypothetical protein [Terriglobia bacterium]